MMARARLVVSGNAQSVGYRALVKIIARSLGVKGLVRNLEDGTVEIFAEADEKTLERFKTAIAKKAEDGDALSIDVSEINVFPEGDANYTNPPGDFKLFDIDYRMELDKYQRESMERTEMGILVLSGTRGDIREVGRKVDGVGEKIDGVGQKVGENIEATKEVGQKVDRNIEVTKEVGNKVDNVANKIDGFAEQTDGNFRELDNKYGAISETLVSMNKEQTRTREELTRAVDNLNSLVNSVNTLIKEHIEKDK